MKKFTKIVATISDKRCDVPFIKSLYCNGMNVVRMNSAHLQLDGFQKIVKNVRDVSDKIGILMDTKGPEIRTTINENDATIIVREGDIVRFVGNPGGVTNKEQISLSYCDICNDVKVGCHFLIDDGELDFEIESIDGEVMMCKALNGGELGSRKSVNIPGVGIKLPSLTSRDIINIGYAIDMGVDFIAHSFVRCKQDILDIQAILDARESNIKIIAKIENQEGIDNFDEILEVAYGIMIARGDLGIEIPAERIPNIQNELIKKCILHHKPVIVATQMLHSMISNPRPTRAEVSDIANAVYQHTDALMLSGETAYGKYPVEAISTMTRVAVESEKTMNIDDGLIPRMEDDVTSFLAHQAVMSSKIVGSRAIITDSYTGRTARYISSFRGSYPTLALCYHQEVIRILSLSYGVFPFYQQRTKTSREYLYHGLKHLIELGLLTHENTIAYLGGAFGEGHGTTFLEINNVGEVMKNYDYYDLPNLENVERCKKI
ncbi:MAG: pyruvate kinase [Muribaculaceae bacterium]